MGNLTTPINLMIQTESIDPTTTEKEKWVQIFVEERSTICLALPTLEGRIMCLSGSTRFEHFEMFLHMKLLILCLLQSNQWWPMS